MFGITKRELLIFIAVTTFIFSISYAEEEEIYLKSISDQIQVITKDLKTLEKAVYKESDITSLSNASNDTINEDVLTKHLLKLNDIENHQIHILK